jgi:prepilin-type N-terminal cleavage/methylation domain-containing protein/prepilin-type processing-associated H-X9-DG protein
MRNAGTMTTSHTRRLGPNTSQVISSLSRTNSDNHICRRPARHQNPLNKVPGFLARGFTLNELLAVIAIIGILAGLLVSALSRGMTSGKSAVCRNNFRQLGLGLNLYASELEKYPLYYGPGGSWNQALAPYLGVETWTLRCPFDKIWPTYQYNAWGTGWSPGRWTAQGLGLGGFDFREGPGVVSGSFNGTPIAEARVRAPSDMLAFMEVVFDVGYSGFGWPGVPQSNHADRRSSGAFCDGHVESSNPDRIPKITTSRTVFKPEAAYARRWNNDNEPHPETWPKN